jgi:hypothetical protein
MGIDYVREYLPFLPHVATLIAMYTCVAVVIALFVWGFVRRYRAYTRGGASLWAAVPHYVQLAPSPPAAKALCERLSGVLSAQIDVSELADAADEYVDRCRRP